MVFSLNSAEADFPESLQPHRVLLVRSVPLDWDSRSAKMIADYRRRGFKVVKLFWSRSADHSPQADSIIFSNPAPYGARFGNAFNYIRWQAFVGRTLSRLRTEFDIVHCIDFQTALTAVPLGLWLRKIVVFEDYDHFASTFGPRTLLRRFFAGLERRLLTKANIAILPDPIRLVQYGLREDDHVRFIANIPDDDGVAEVPIDRHSANRTLTFAYVGTLEADRRGLEYIPRLCSEHGDKIRFVVCGFGRLADYFREQAETVPNLQYVGRQSYETSLRFMREADCLYGPYLLNAETHRFAAPNKMYEHLMVGRPLLTNRGTPPGDLVEANGTGFLFDGSYADLTRLLGGLSREECADRGAIARRLWVDRFGSLRRQQVEDYFSRLGSLLSRPARARGD
jgi:glycosyltransferase involved in cell wall biosynthesis